MQHGEPDVVLAGIDEVDHNFSKGSLVSGRFSPTKVASPSARWPFQSNRRTADLSSYRAYIFGNSKKRGAHLQTSPSAGYDSERPRFHPPSGKSKC